MSRWANRADRRRAAGASASPGRYRPGAARLRRGQGLGRTRCLGKVGDARAFGRDSSYGVRRGGATHSLRPTRQCGEQPRPPFSRLHLWPYGPSSWRRTLAALAGSVTNTSTHTLYGRRHRSPAMPSTEPETRRRGRHARGSVRGLTFLRWGWHRLQATTDVD